jgi:hypothetical protein
MLSKTHLTTFAVTLIICILPSLAYPSSRMCASEVAATGDRGLVNAFRGFRGACSGYQGCVDKVTKSENVALNCRSECGPKTGAQKQQCISSCLGGKAKSSQLRGKIAKSCGSLRSQGKCKQMTLRFSEALSAAGSKSSKAIDSCAMFMGKK